MIQQPEKLSWINRLHGFHKLVISLVVGLTMYFAVQPGNDPIIHIMIGWDAGCAVLLLLSWISFFTITPKQIREQYKKQDETRLLIFLIIVVSALASLSAIVDLFLSKSPYLAVAVSGMMLSWALVHTIFASRYAHLYYGNDKNDSSVHAGGLMFPHDTAPAYLDFAYFSFVVGMTFQVSDVQVTSKRIRRLVLVHGLISFCFNTFIVALTISLIGTMMQGKF
jgi:uncharacterized membrane protein